MPSYEVKDVLAEREIIFCGDDGSSVPGHIKIGRPEVRSEHDWVCPYEISVGDTKKSFGIYGVDSIQALVLTLKTVDVEIGVKAKELGLRPTWLGEDYDSVFDPRDVIRD